jgi:hypothetical protein
LGELALEFGAGIHPLYHAALNDARFADREVGIAP